MHGIISGRHIPRFVSQIPVLLAAGVGLSLAILYHNMKGEIATKLPQSEWVYLSFAVMTALVVVVSLFDRRFRSTLTGVLLIVILAIAGFVASTSIFLYKRLNRIRSESVAKRATLVQDYRIKPPALSSEQPAGFVPIGSLYQLSFNHPQTMYANEDGEVELSNVYISPQMLDALKPFIVPPNVPEMPEIGGLPRAMRQSFDMQEIDATVQLASRSFLIDPPDEVKFPLIGGGPRLKFVITPQQTGKRKILVRSKLRSDVLDALKGVADFDLHNTVLSISVLPERTIAGLTASQLQHIQFLSSAIGFPALAVYALTVLRDYRKERREREQRPTRKRGKK